MIWLYSGTPGSGKSLHMARDILHKLRRKQNVIANFPINMELVQKGIFGLGKRKTGLFTYIDNSELTVKYLAEYAFKNHKQGKEGQTLLCIDECQVIYNAREFNNKERLEWVKFYSQHRKLGYNVILVSQNDRMIDRQIRCLIEYDIKHRKANSFGTIGMLIPIPLFAAVTYWYGVKEKCGVEFFTYNKKYAKLYDSYAVFDEKTKLVQSASSCGGGEESGSAGGDTPPAGTETEQHNGGLNNGYA